MKAGKTLDKETVTKAVESGNDEEGNAFSVKSFTKKAG